MEPHFDHHQFERKFTPYNKQIVAGGFTINGDAQGLDGKDYEQGLSTFRAPGQRSNVPPFARTPHLLKEVLYVRLWNYVHVEKRWDEKIDWQALDHIATEKLLRTRCNPKQEAHKRAVLRAGSYLALQTAIAYRAWNLGWPAQQIADELEVPRGVIRAALFNIRRTAERIGLDVGPHGNSWKGRALKPIKPRIRYTKDQILSMIENDGILATACRLGMHQECLRTQLRKWGVTRDHRCKPYYFDWRKRKSA